MAISVNYLNDHKSGHKSGQGMHKAIRLDNEVMHLLKAAPALTDAYNLLQCVYRLQNPHLACDAGLNVRINEAIAQASKTTY